MGQQSGRLLSGALKGPPADGTGLVNRRRCCGWPTDKMEGSRQRRAVLEGKKRGGGVRNTNRNEPARGRSLRHGQDMGKTHDHRNGIEQRLAVGGGWRWAVGGWRSRGAALKGYQ